MNKLYLVHRPTEQYCLIAQRDSFGWRPLLMDNGYLSNMMQRAANGLAALPEGHQDDWVLILDDARGAPFAYDTFSWDGNEIELAAPVAFPGARYEDVALTSQMKTLRAVLDTHPIAFEPTPTPHQELKTIERLLRENDELRKGVALLAELIRIDRAAAAGTPTLAMTQKLRGDWSVTWIKAQDWVAGLAERVRNWGL